MGESWCARWHPEQVLCLLQIASTAFLVAFLLLLLMMMMMMPSLMVMMMIIIMKALDCQQLILSDDHDDG